MDNMPFSSALSEEDIDLMIARDFPDCEPIAVIGYSCHFPQAPDGETFWNNLLAGRECNTRFTREALLAAGLDPATIDAPDYVNSGTVLENAGHFDAALFGYSRQEAESIDPQQRLFLQSVWHALEHAGYAPGAVPHKTGVFASSRISTYPGREALNVTEVAQVKGLQSLMGNDKDYIATRAAYKLNLHGPALSVQTACSSSLVAVHLASESLRAGESDMAVAGGVALSFPQEAGYRYQPGMIFSPDARCRPFDADAAGTWPGNGLGCVVLRRLRDALLARDPIVSVILSSAVNNDGSRKVGYTAPSAAGQQAVIEEALMLAGLDSSQIGYVEAHGTGTPLGDAIEMEALRNAFASGHRDKPCALGSVKSNMGHLDTAAGIAGLLKTILAVSRGQIPPTLHFRTPNPALRLEESAFTVPVTPRAWNDDRRYAGISSFGIGGTNCHMIVASLPDGLRRLLEEPKDGQKSQALLLSAASEHSLQQLAAQYAAELAQQADADNLAYTALRARRLDLPYRLAVALDSETPDALAAWASSSPPPQVYAGHGSSGKLVWMFTGQGSHWRTMGQTMYQHSAAFAGALDRCFAACDTLLTPPLKEAMFSPESALLENMAWAQPAIVAFEIAMAAHWQSVGLKPDFALGHSVGEFAAAAVCGHYAIEEIMPLVCLRGALMQESAGGGMVAVFAEEAALLAPARQCGLDLAANNGRQHTVFSGPEENLAAFCEALEQQNINYRRLSVTGAAHSALLDPILDRFQTACARLHASPGHIQLISTLTAEPVDETVLNQPDYWRQHMRQPVRFMQSIERARGLGAGVFLELGPDAQLVAAGQREHAENVFWIASARRQLAASAALTRALLQLYAAGAVLPWADLLAGDGQRVSAPRYPFDGKQYWKESSAAVNTRHEATDSVLAAGQQVAIDAAAALDLPRLEALKQCTTRLHTIYVDRVIQRCVGDDIDQGVDLLTILRRGRLLPRYQQLLQRLLNNCVADGDYHYLDGRYFRSRPVASAQCEPLLAELTGYCEGFQSIPDTVARAGEKLYDMMSGREDPVSVIFPQGASDGVEVLYQEFSFGRYFNQIAAGAVRGILRAHPQDRPLRILEVGGGTGGTTAWLLPELINQPGLEYHFTDISALFTRRAQQKFADYHFMQYRELDLEKEALAQGFREQEYDLIVAANVIHATRHIGRTLDNLRPLLRPGGRLLMREITQPMRLFDFVFGPLVLPLQDLDSRDGELFLTTGHWEQQCRRAGFSQVNWLPHAGSRTADMSEHIILATLPGGQAYAPSETGEDLAAGGTGGYLADWSDCANNPERFAARWREARQRLSDRYGDGAPAAAEPGTAPSWLGKVRLSWQQAPFSPGEMRVEARHPRGEWQTLAPDWRPPVPQTHYQWQWSRVTETAQQQTQPFTFYSDALTRRAGELRQYGIVHDSSAGVTLMLAGEEEDAAALAEKVREALCEREGGLIVLTRRAWRIRGDETLLPTHHALWALLRVAASEQPDRAIAAIDLDDDSPIAMWSQALRAVTPSRRWIALRGDDLLTPSLVASETVAAELPADIFSGDSRWHLVTGAFGGLGRLAVSWLKQRGARRIALIAPRGETSTEVNNDDIEIRFFPCDAGDPQQLGAVLAALNARGGIAGAIHAAGMLADAPLRELEAQKLKEVFAVKARAAQQLLEALREAAGRYLILYSSAAAALGASGQAAHALACGYLDGLAQQFSNLTTPKVISVAWGAWSESGRAATPEMLAALADKGMLALSDDEGLWHLEQAIMRAAPWRLAMRVSIENMPPVQRLLFAAPERAASAPASAATPPADEGSFNGSLEDQSAVLAWISRRVAMQLRLHDASALSPQQDLLQLGMDSLLFLELSADIQRYLGVRISAERAWQDLSPAGLTQLVVKQPAAVTSAPAQAVLQHDAGQRYAPFPLTPIQHAYWLGRTHLIGYGGVACHVLFEWDKRRDELDIAGLESAWNQLIRRHDMLRMVVDSDGQQRVLQETPEYRIPVHNLRNLTPAQQQLALEERRHALSYNVLPADRWPLFELLVSELDDERYRLHMNLDLLQFDVQSFKIMMDDLAAAWRGETLPPLEIAFRDYVMAEQARRHSPAWHDAREYWQEKLPLLPPAPELPVVETPPETPHFTTFQAVIARDAWQALKLSWQQQGVTASAALLTLFAITLERWSRSAEFTLNLTFFNRRLVHPQVNQLIGDFTSVTLVDFNIQPEIPLQAQMQQTQTRLWQNMAHSEMNGVETIRELGRLRGSQRQPLMPVVFTSMLGMTLEGMEIDRAMSHLFGEPCYVFTQTPQVWLDHQVMESDGELIFSWYCMDNVLQPGVAEAMFNDYRTLVQKIAGGPAPETPFAEMQPRRRWPLAGQTAFDLRDIEQAATAFSGIRQARAEIAAENALRLDVVVEDAAEPASPRPDASALSGLALALPDRSRLDELDATWRWLEARALHGIAATLTRHGLFTAPGETHTFEALAQKLSAGESHHRLLRQWLQYLTEAQWISRVEDSWRCITPLDTVAPPHASPPDAPWSRTLAQYLNTCIAQHDALFAGRRSPLELLFSEQLPVTDALYRENPASESLNRYAAQIAALAGAQQILEVGAGTAATAEQILAATRETRKSYNFTDVSPQFLSDGRAQFAGEPGVSYALFDINAPLNFSDHPEDGYDLIVAVNVLHDASHVVQSLRRLKLLLKPGGRLMIIEATERSSAFQLATVGFVEGLSGYRDFRLRDEKPMLALATWQEVLTRAGFIQELCWPEQDPSPLHQHLLVARSFSTPRVDKHALAQHLQQRFGTGLPPLQIRQRETLYIPQKTASAPLPAPAQNPRLPAENPALEKAVAELWQTLLMRPVDRRSDFFDAGGDSLMATRMVAQLNQRGIAKADLRDLFNYPTLGDFCRHLQVSAPGDDRPVPLCLGDSSETLYVFHASDGDISAWLPLAGALNMRTFGLQASSPGRYATLQQMIDEYVRRILLQQPAGPYVLAGWSYGTFLAAGAAQRLHDRGEQVRLVLIDPVCRRDFHCQDRTALLHLLSRGDTPLQLPENFDCLTPDEQLSAFIKEAKKAGILAQNRDPSAAAGWLDDIGHLLSLLANDIPADAVDLPCLILHATRRPARWTPASADWQTWMDSATQYAIEASHWEIMLDNQQVKNCARRITQWLAATPSQPENRL